MLLKLRQQIKRSDLKIQGIMPDAIHEALTILGTEKKSRFHPVRRSPNAS